MSNIVDLGTLKYSALLRILFAFFKTVNYFTLFTQQQGNMTAFNAMFVTTSQLVSENRMATLPLLYQQYTKLMCVCTPVWISQTHALLRQHFVGPN